MPRNSTFWSWHASVNDDVRHDLIEKGWFGRQTTQDINSRDMPALGAENDQQEAVGAQQSAEQQFPEIYGQSQQTEQEQEL
ncbi:MAG: hypothetical protein WA790_02920 [Sulfitobacter sp.]